MPTRGHVRRRYGNLLEQIQRELAPRVGAGWRALLCVPLRIPGFEPVTLVPVLGFFFIRPKQPVVAFSAASLFKGASRRSRWAEARVR